MTKNDSVRVTQVGNGFLVEQGALQNCAMPLTDVQVFQSLQGLICFLEGHFDHRDDSVERDEL